MQIQYIFFFKYFIINFVYHRKLIDGCREIAAEYSDIKFDIMIINNTCMQLVNRPTQFDVTVTTNLCGNMVSNVCTVLVTGSKYGEHDAIFQ
ncbi:unnamed protein product [Rotaria magnacalcarata]|uniref:isocitrate dehydrogenase (NAD(+)) n=1 Tax=Rotaria magnacalcarata TaxID=392030 RepID=A0A820YRB2_9BILA|nr:unnamed protein product [Rotaria magnacalcarata]